MNVFCLNCNGMQPGIDRRGCGITEEICCKCGCVCDSEIDDDDPVHTPEQQDAIEESLFRYPTEIS